MCSRSLRVVQHSTWRSTVVCSCLFYTVCLVSGLFRYLSKDSRVTTLHQCVSHSFTARKYFIFSCTRLKTTCNIFKLNEWNLVKNERNYKCSIMKTLDFVSSMLRSGEDQMHHFWVGKTTTDIGFTKINFVCTWIGSRSGLISWTFLTNHS